MPERKGGETARPTTPDRFAETLPPEVANNHSFSIQAIFELQRSFGKVEQAVENLQKKAEDQAATLKTIEKTIWIATGAFVIVSGIIGFAIKYGLDMLTAALAKH